MPVIDQWFTLATAGETIDGREIEESWLREMAETYNTDYYTAVIDADHELDWYGAFGHVTEVRLGDKLGRVSLDGKLNANHRLMEMNRTGQRMWFSIWPREVEGKHYLFRLAVTDSPASLGTDYMKFCTQPNGQKPQFTAPKPLDLHLEQPEDQPPGWFKNFLKTFTGHKPTPETEQDDDMTPEQLNQITDAIKAQGEQFTSALAALKPATANEPETPEPEQFSAADIMSKLDGIATKQTELETQFAELKKTPAGGTNTPDHTGGADDIEVI